VTFLTKEYRWPKKGDDPFLAKSADPNSPTWASLQWLVSMRVDDTLLADAFKEAGDKVVEELSRGKEGEHPDMYFLPIAYLYRHALQLKMKRIIRLGIKLYLVELDENLEASLEKHKLHQLWNFTREVIEGYWPKSAKEDLNAAGKIVQEFHKIDKSGQRLRYTKDKDGKSTLAVLPESVQLTHLRDVFEAVFNYLDSIEAGLSEAPYPPDY